MEILINNRPLSAFSVHALEYTQAFGVAAERQDQRTWADKSGVDVLLSNRRYDVRPFSLLLYTKASTLHEAHQTVTTLTSYLYQQGNFVLSFRNGNLRYALLCNRTEELGSTVTVYEQKSVYVFRLFLQDVNPNALKYYTAIDSLTAAIVYQKGVNANIYWGDGRRGVVSNSTTYTQTAYTADGLVDIIVDVDTNAPNVSTLQAAFTASATQAIKPATIQFTNQSTGVVELYAWNFGDGTGSSEENPQHTYTQAGTYTVTLQVFNAVNGSSTETKIAYITIRDARLKLNETNFFKNNDTNYLLKN
jgi:hypothetical protein